MSKGLLKDGIIKITAGIVLMGLLLFRRSAPREPLSFKDYRSSGWPDSVDTGLYGIVRHPMYTATVLLFLSMPPGA